MRFTVVVMQINGDITDRRAQTWADIQRYDVGRRWTEIFRLTLDEQLPAWHGREAVPQREAVFSFPLLFPSRAFSCKGLTSRMGRVECRVK